MKLENANITAILEEAESLLNAETGISPALATSMKLILVVMKLLIDRPRLNSSNSSIPPSQAPNRKEKRRGKEKRRVDKRDKRGT